MPNKKKTILFDAETVPLQDSNLIEASAGTGKTYSIAILSLRLLLEQNIPIQEILMVTFTKAAVAELETRIRAFVRIAHEYSMGNAIKDETISAIVDKSVKALGKQETELRLKNAVLFMDETAILTIHSFCQRVLGEFAFETNQLFGADAMNEGDLTDITENEVNIFWRKHILVLDLGLLRHIIPSYFSKELLLKFLNNSLGGKKLVALTPYNPAILSEQNLSVLMNRLNQHQDDADGARDNALIYIQANKNALVAAVLGNTNAQKKYGNLFDKPDALLDEILKNTDKQYVQKIFAAVLEILQPLILAKTAIDQLLQEFSNGLYQLAINNICEKVQQAKEKKSLLAFDDMIYKLHDAVVVQQNQQLITALRLKYKAVFIDEFQDTDKLQYEIFNALFGATTILFYIGDPKQSIYAWRKADILTYFKAGNTVKNRYSMNTNYRSGNGIIDAQNSFFLPREDFDTFYFGDAVDAIQYVNVEAPQENEKGNLQLNGEAVKPLTIYENNNNNDIYISVAATVIQLLDDKGYTLNEKNNSRRVRPSDIGILVRSNDKAKELKETLAWYKIPSVTIDETKLSDTEEAKELLYLLKAVNDINASNINKALLSGLTGYSIEDLLNLNEEYVLNQFKTYQQTWSGDGIYVMLMKFITDYRVKTRMLQSEAENGERRLSNILQLLELLHKMQTRKQYSPVELINWLQKAIEGQTTEGDEFEQRMESDEDAVKIVTIHKSKGLEYNIVIAPFLDLDTKIRDINSFRDDATGDYLFASKDILTDDQVSGIETQLEQENRRLIYVAITRAKYKCYLYNNLAGVKKSSSLKSFVNAIDKANTTTIAFENAPDIPVDYSYNSDTEKFPVEYKKASNFTLRQLNWRKMSYTYLNPEHSPVPKSTSAESRDAYSDFVFGTLKKGAYTGNLLHYIFEFIRFGESSYWQAVIAKALKRLSPANTDAYAEKLLELLQHTTQTTLDCNGHSFSLAEIEDAHCLNEFEFDFMVQPFQVQQIKSLSTDTIPLQVRSHQQLEGIMNGKMDLFFEKDGKYYILDWKSNYLGDRLADYSKEKVWEAMAENNYHLQYHIYTVAICKYLAMRIPGFNYETHFGGVIYLFVRGVRRDQTAGIFFTKPDRNTIEQLTGCLSGAIEEVG